MKIYILLDEYLNTEHHCEFVDVFDSAEAVLKYIAENQSDGHKFKYEVREFNPTNPSDNTLTMPTAPQPIDLMLRHACTRTDVSVNSDFLEHTDGTPSVRNQERR